MESNTILENLKTSEDNDNKQYFDNQDPEEESMTTISTELNQQYQKVELLYDQIVPLDNYPAAKKKSLSERARLKLKNDKTYTYGEMTFRTMSYIFEVIRNTWGKDSINPGDFYDLGSVKYILKLGSWKRLRSSCVDPSIQENNRNRIIISTS